MKKNIKAADKKKQNQNPHEKADTPILFNVLLAKNWARSIRGISPGFQNSFPARTIPPSDKKPNLIF